MQENTNPQKDPPEPAGKRFSRAGWLFLVVALLVLVIAVVIVVRVAVPLAGLLYPADPPFYADARLLERRQLSFGVDEWLFASSEPGCAVYEWYQQYADECRPSPNINCALEMSLPQHSGVFSVGYCTGRLTFGKFAADWEIFVSDGYNDADGRTRFLVAREVDWINQD